MSKRDDKLKKRIEEIEVDIYKLEQTINVIRNTYEDRFTKILGVIVGNGKMTSFSNYQEISLDEFLGSSHGL